MYDTCMTQNSRSKFRDGSLRTGLGFLLLVEHVVSPEVIGCHSDVTPEFSESWDETTQPILSRTS